jgi:hypothetical protein
MKRGQRPSQRIKMQPGKNDRILVNVKVVVEVYECEPERLSEDQEADNTECGSDKPHGIPNRGVRVVGCHS